MLQIIIKNVADYCRDKNRWWIPLIAGLFFALSLPPFNHEFHWFFSLFPFLTFVVLIPLMFFALQKSLKKAVLFTFLYSFSAALGQLYWIGFVTAEGLWHLILIGVFLISTYLGLIFLSAGLLFRVVYKTMGRFYLVLFPAIWVSIDFFRSVGEIPFPWSFLGYSYAPMLPLAQVASITGVWGLTFIAVVMNVLIFDLLICYYRNENQAQKWIHLAIGFLCLVAISVWGNARIKKPLLGDYKKIAVLQTNMDQLHWGNNSLDTAFTITEKMVKEAALHNVNLIVGPESALLCFVDRKPEHRIRVQGWVDSINRPLILGGLHWDRAPEGAVYEYYIYNSAFFIEPFKPIAHYNKQKLVPFSEKMPFENFIPILSRVNLGEADFMSGKDPVVFQTDSIRAAPFICYEVIFPSFVQERLKKNANLIVTITNDGWFGMTSGPYQHAMMARMRAIENRISVVRCANSGFSMFIDGYGKVTNTTRLYTRTTIYGDVLLRKADSFYAKYGDWFLILCMLIASSGLALIITMSIVRKVKLPKGEIKGI
jgi:apolipoprotein N-acyltransferase